MKSLKKYISLLAVAALACGSVACSDDGPEYEPALPVPDDCMQLCFSADNQSKYTFLTSDPVSEMVINLTLRRTKSETALSVPIKITSGEEMFAVPATAEFAAGQTETSIGVTPLEVKGGTFNFAVAIDLEGDQFIDPYTQLGSPAFGAEVTFEEWEVFQGWAWSYYTTGSVIPCTIMRMAGTDHYRISGLYEGMPEFDVVIDWEHWDSYGYYLQFVESDHLRYIADDGYGDAGYDYFDYSGNAISFIYASSGSGYGSNVHANDGSALGLEFTFSTYDYTTDYYDYVYVYTD